MSPENVIDGFKYITMALGAVFVAWEKLRPHLHMGRQSKELRKLEFISGFLAFGIEYRNRLVVEKAFSTFFKQKLMYEEIVALMRFRNVTAAFDLYKNCRAFVDVNGDGFFSYADGMDEKNKRRNKKIIYMIFYAVFYAAAFVPAIWLLDNGAIQSLPSAIIVSLWVVAFSICAWVFIDGAVSIGSAERFMKQQEKCI